MMYMVVEDFREGCVQAVFRRAAEHGRMLPDGVEYIDSWVSKDLSRCYQLMRCEDRSLLDEWMAEWSDLVAFEVVPVLSSREASAVATDHGANRSRSG